MTGLSEAFRPDLTGSALIDIQGDVQSVRGGSATGMVLNDNGNLNLVKFASVSNSTIVGQPVEPPPDPETLARTVSSSRPHSVADTPAGRNGVTVDTSLNPIGPLSQTNDGPLTNE